MKSDRNAGRPEKTNVDYFPHYVHRKRELELIEHRHGSDGYSAYFRLLELVAESDYHKLELSNRDQLDIFEMKMKVDKSIYNNVIQILINAGKIDKDLWEEEKIIWMDEFVQSLSPVWYKRGKQIPTKDEIALPYGISVTDKSISDTRNSQKRKEKKSEVKESEVKESEVTTHTNKISLESLINEFPQLDVQGIWDRSAALKNHSPERVLEWLKDDLENGNNLKPKEFRKMKSGLLEAFCYKCGKRHMPNDHQLKQGSSCCGVELVPDKPTT